MKLFNVCLIAAATLVPLAAAPAQEVEHQIVTTYHAAPGHQLELLRWLAGQDRISEAAGVPAMQLYVHTDGASWDYLAIQPVTTPEQDAAVEAAAVQLGTPQGPGVGIELRRHILSHEDSYVNGPTTAAAFLSLLEE